MAKKNALDWQPACPAGRLAPAPECKDCFVGGIALD